MEINPIDETEEDLAYASKEYPFIIKAGKVPDCCLNYPNLVPTWLYICGGAEMGYVTAQELIFQCKTCGKYILAKVFTAKDGTCYVTQENTREVVLRNALTDALGRLWYMFKIPRSLAWDDLVKYHILAEHKRFSFNIANGELMAYPDMQGIIPDVFAIASPCTPIMTNTSAVGEELPPVVTHEELIERGKEVLTESNPLPETLSETLGLTDLAMDEKLVAHATPIIGSEAQGFSVGVGPEIPMVNRYLKKLALGEPLDAQDELAKKIYDMINKHNQPIVKEEEDVEPLEDIFFFRLAGHVTKEESGHLAYVGKVEFNEIYCKSFTIVPETLWNKEDDTVEYLHVQDRDPRLLTDLKNRTCLRLKNVVYRHIHIDTKKEYWVYVDELVITVHNSVTNVYTYTTINLDISIGTWKKSYIKIADVPDDEDDFKFDTEFPEDDTPDTDGVHTELSCGKEGYCETDGECARCRNKECDS